MKVWDYVRVCERAWVSVIVSLRVCEYVCV